MARKLRGYGLVRRGEHLGLYVTLEAADEARQEELDFSEMALADGWTVSITTPNQVWIEKVYSPNW